MAVRRAVTVTCRSLLAQYSLRRERCRGPNQRTNPYAIADLTTIRAAGATGHDRGTYDCRSWFPRCRRLEVRGKGTSRVSYRISAAVVWLCAGLSCAMAQELKVRLPKSCAILSAELGDEIKRLRALQEQAKRERAAPAPDVVSAFGRVFGNKDAGVQALKDIKFRRAVADELNAALRSNHCTPIDIEAELSQLH